ncbi:GNAT family N-acetyltransferase [Yunchengibacter salinarum]|uniref:GNAT family N-acetyltransferase n=1 Tax=Yunchengibacter salinarum TaxID=3133399 RepID=UPI0035B63EB6
MWKVQLRPASREDVPALMVLVTRASATMAYTLWESVAEGQDPFAFGMAQIGLDEGRGSYRNATMAMDGDGILLGGMITYPVDDAMVSPAEWEGAHETLAPISELVRGAHGALYVDSIAVFPEAEGRGAGRALLKAAFNEARARHGGRTALVVAESNHRAVRLYQKLGFRVMDRRPIIPWPHCPFDGDWLLMVRHKRGHRRR